jgi:hypothetical protein
MTAVGCGAVEVNPPQHSIKQREKCGLAHSRFSYSLDPKAVNSIAERKIKFS